MTRIDAIVIGSGFGGAMAAYPLVHAGWNVLMVERGGWVERGPRNWARDGVKDLSPYHEHRSSYKVSGDDRLELGGTYCVGGQSVFFGGVSMRLRERDFDSTAADRAAGAEWPFAYDELERYYSAAERIIGVAGETGIDPTEPWRSSPYSHSLPPLSRTSCRIADAAERVGYTPFRLPLAINYAAGGGRSSCIACSNCDCYACGISAKNDIATAVLPDLVRRGLRIITGTAAVRLIRTGRQVTAVECADTSTGIRTRYSARAFILAAGALATPQLLLASGADAWHPSGRMVGRGLMRHCNAITFGLYRDALDHAREFHKQVGINDLYFGSNGSRQSGTLGTIQQIHGPPPGLLPRSLTAILGSAGERVLDRLTGMIVIAADAPVATNQLTLSRESDYLGMPRANIHHRYTPQDLNARAELVTAARAVLRESGSVTTITRNIRTFSHGLGSVRLGRSTQSAPLDPTCRYRGADNLYVTDASGLPTSGGVNPSLTVAAVALRAGCLLAGKDVRRLGGSARLTIMPEVIHA